MRENRIMLARLQRFAKKSRMFIIFYEIVNNWRTKRQLNAGKIQGTSGTTHARKTLQQSLDYINQVFEDYLIYSGISVNMLQGKRILEIGPGDNLGVALKFLLAG